ncbi:MAG: PBP1A family penicillin-binding protein [Acidobacteria bacterium]|nr:PBP1A family penicillin-binding protein [Acidobacteriota bacterium]MCA1637559.1 PBP1A family penicillin-binding protein [Acidobacteriota bacterium]
MSNEIQVKSKGVQLSPQIDRKAVRINAFQQRPPNLFRRILRLIFNPVTISIGLILLLGVFLTLAYFWFEYSDRVDLLLRGEVFTRTAGIYSAPKTLRTGENISLEDLTTYLKSAGYIEKNNRADAARSRYKIEENKIEIEPGKTALIDNKKTFPALSVEFKKGWKSVASITDKEADKQVKQAQIEPKILSSIAAEGDGKRKVVTFQDLPPHLIKAITVTEDRAFFEHYGVNFRGIARALWRRYESEENSPIARQGGSSITQQLVKNLLLSNDPTIERKLKEAYMSVILETRLTKEEIFTLYANQIYLGQQTGTSIYGVGEAANAYFGKDVSALNLAESAFIAGIIRSPNRYNPYKNLEKVTERRNQVLDSMLEAGTISSGQALEAKNTPLELYRISSQRDLQGMQYFSQYAIEELPKFVNDPEALGHLRVYTTIDPDLQKAAYEIVNRRLEKLDKYFPKKPKGNLQAALVAIRPKTGEIVAMVGGRDFLKTQFNRATDAQRQPGSVFKPFVYASAINTVYDSSSRVVTAATVFKDEKKVFAFGNDTYSPNNYGDTFSNQEMTVRDALVKSKNVITVDLATELNISKVMNFAHKAGLPKVEKAYPSMALGTSEATPLQIATAYTIFANLGDKVSPLPINRVTNGEGTTVVAPVAEKKNVLRPDVAYIMDDMMKDVINRGTAYEAQAWGFKNVAGKTAFAGKTGTSRDGWFAGFTPELVTVVYVGFDDGDDLGMKGSDSAMPIWADFMREALNEYPEWNGDWQMPDTIRKAEIDARNGTLIRELSNGETNSPQIEQTESENNIDANVQIPLETPEVKNIYVSDVPGEFRRVELFISGTVPNKILLPSEEATVIEEESLKTVPLPSDTPLTNWQEAQQRSNQNSSPQRRELTPDDIQRNITVTICPLTEMRATANCPNPQTKTFAEGEQPKNFCTFHVDPPK